MNSPLLKLPSGQYVNILLIATAIPHRDGTLDLLNDAGTLHTTLRDADAVAMKHFLDSEADVLSAVSETPSKSAIEPEDVGRRFADMVQS